MKLSSKAGFTIIETMLFLGITGLLILGVLVGTNGSITNQRYRDSVTSLQAILQEQYSNALSTDNSHDNTFTCNSTDASITKGALTDIYAGQSECVLLGKYVTYADDGKLVIRKIVGYVSPDVTTKMNDLLALKDYKIMPLPITDTSSETYDIEWGSTLVGNVDADTSHINFAILILRSPSSGVSRTFTNTYASPSLIPQGNDITGLVDDLYLKHELNICVKNSDSSLGNIGRSAVHVIANATGTSGVQFMGEATSKCN